MAIIYDRPQEGLYDMNRAVVIRRQQAARELIEDTCQDARQAYGACLSNLGAFTLLHKQTSRAWAALQLSMVITDVNNDEHVKKMIMTNVKQMADADKPPSPPMSHDEFNNKGELKKMMRQQAKCCLICCGPLDKKGKDCTSPCSQHVFHSICLYWWNASVIAEGFRVECLQALQDGCPECLDKTK